MKKRAMVVAMATALVLSQNTLVFAAVSPDSGMKLTNVTTTNDSGNSSEDTYGNAVEGEEDALNGLDETNKNQIRQMNKGADLNSLGIKNLDLSGYKLLNKTRAIMTYEKGTKIEKKANTTITLSVPNMKSGLSNVQILFFNNMTGRWQTITPVRVDGAHKQVTVTIPNSGTVAVMYK